MLHLPVNAAAYLSNKHDVTHVHCQLSYGSSLCGWEKHQFNIQWASCSGRGELAFVIILTHWLISPFEIWAIIFRVWYSDSYIEYYPGHSLWNCSQVNATEPHSWEINIGWDYGLVHYIHQVLAVFRQLKIYNTIFRGRLLVHSCPSGIRIEDFWCQHQFYNQ